MNKVAKKIDRWHDEKLDNKEDNIFERDEEYMEQDRSPTNFETSSDEDDLIKIKDQSLHKRTESTKFSENLSNNSHKKL